MKEWNKSFYSGKAWQRTREEYKKSRGGLCERCLAKGLYNPCEIVHHKIELTPENINDPSITLTFDNLQCLCRECHSEVHGQTKRRWRVNPDGTIAPHSR